MTYTSISFYLFLAAVLLVYYMLPVSSRWFVLLVGSIVFYLWAYRTGWWILLIQILLTYMAGMWMGSLDGKNTEFMCRLKKTVFAMALLATVIPWLCIKNGDFVLGSILHRPRVTWIIPLGISFYTLQMVSYLADIYKGKEFDSSSPMSLVLVGQTELWEQKLRLQAYTAIRQRIDMNIVLGRLDRSETGKYIAAHLAYSGVGKEIFTSGAEDEVYKISAGIPRMIN